MEHFIDHIFRPRQRDLDFVVHVRLNPRATNNIQWAKIESVLSDEKFWACTALAPIILRAILIRWIHLKWVHHWASGRYEFVVSLCEFNIAPLAIYRLIWATSGGVMRVTLHFCQASVQIGTLRQEDNGLERQALWWLLCVCLDQHFQDHESTLARLCLHRAQTYVCWVCLLVCVKVDILKNIYVCLILTFGCPDASTLVHIVEDSSVCDKKK